QLADGADDFDPAPGVHREPRAVVSAVFEAPQPLHENRCTILRADVRDDSAHGLSLLPRQRLIQCRTNGNPSRGISTSGGDALAGWRGPTTRFRPAIFAS